ncbi:MAG: S46 family peptidase [Prolixibacteraceae bacterium]|nr:S46 family peptidase [Prolixibacteraceae bacterium]
MKLYKSILLMAMLVIGLAVKADEGMWLPSFLNKVQIEKMHKLGAKLTAEDIFSINSSSLKDAVISLNGGSCTGELVSDQGLFLTNHHCGYGQIQQHSSEERNILKNGFWAANKSDELPNEGMFVSFLVEVDDVTDRILSKVNGHMNESERLDSINAEISLIVNEATDSTHYNATVKPFFNDNQYILFVYETYRDVRLVGAPPHFIGKFGGDTDNWMWPRHTGDFSMFRIYTAPDGTPAEYSEENIPLQPRHFFPISLKGYTEGDFAMVMGYPGSTNRYLTANGVKYTMDVVNTTRITAREPKLKIIREYMATGDAATIQYASKHARSSNYYKYSIGQNRGIERLDLVERKLQVEKNFQDWLSKNAERQTEYSNALSLINEAYGNIDDDKAVNFIYEAFLSGPEIFSLAYQFSSVLDNIDNADRLNSTVERLMKRGESFYKDYDSQTDERIVAALTEVYVQNVAKEYHPMFIQQIEKKYKGDYSVWAAKLFKKSIFADYNAYMAFLKKPSAKVLKKDPVFKAANQIFNKLSMARNANVNDKEKLDKGYRLFMAGLLEMENDKAFYPNANSTMRLTYGTVGGYEPRDGVYYDYYTTLSGYIEKEIPGDREFDVWPRLKELYYENDFGQYANKNGMLPTCFISNNDITGGNSGSPVINANGELIGIAFDGNWEAMSGDIVFEPELQKCINVDIRFVMWVIDKFAGASHLVDEMQLMK